MIKTVTGSDVTLVSGTTVTYEHPNVLSAMPAGSYHTVIPIAVYSSKQVENCHVYMFPNGKIGLCFLSTSTSALYWCVYKADTNILTPITETLSRGGGFTAVSTDDQTFFTSITNSSYAIWYIKVSEGEYALLSGRTSSVYCDFDTTDTFALSIRTSYLVHSSLNQSTPTDFNLVPVNNYFLIKTDRYANRTPYKLPNVYLSDIYRSFTGNYITIRDSETGTLYALIKNGNYSSLIMIELSEEED